MRASRSIRALLVGMQHLLGWEPIMDGAEHHRPRGRDRGRGRFARSRAGSSNCPARRSRRSTRPAGELMAHLAQLREIARPLGIGFLGLGMSPKWTRAETPVMPKSRYKIMTTTCRRSARSAST
jgi:glutamate--cysteine ligase